MDRALRYVTFVSGVSGIILAIALYFRWPVIREFWPWGGYTGLSPLSFIFLSSIVAAIAVPTLWISFGGDLRAIVAGAVDLSVTFLGVGIFALQGYLATERQSLLLAAVVSAAAFAAIFGILVFSARFPAKDRRPMPPLVRWSFAFLAFALIVAGTALVTKTPNIFPWRLSTSVSVVYGWIFLGASCYFLYGFFRPLWTNAAGQLLGFLAYDLILIGPFLAHFENVQPIVRNNLIIYTAVLIYTAALAVFYCFINPSTRIWGAPAKLALEA